MKRMLTQFNQFSKPVPKASSSYFSRFFCDKEKIRQEKQYECFRIIKEH